MNDELKRQMAQKDSIIEELSLNLKRTTSNIKILTQNTFESIEKVKIIKQHSDVTTSEVTTNKGFIMKEINEIVKENVAIVIEEQKKLNCQKHPNIVHTEELFINEGKRSISILKERCASNINELIEKKKMSKVEKSFCIYQIAEGMKFIHSKGIIHFGLKPTNIMISADGMIKIDDIGHYKLTNKEDQPIRLNEDIKTLYYISPEIKKNKKEEINEKVDVYSFGSVVYFIMNSGELPKITLKDLIEGKQAAVPTGFTPNMKEIIEYCCNENRNIRPSFNEIVEYLKNPKCQLIEMTHQEHEEYQHLINEHQKLIQQI